MEYFSDLEFVLWGGCRKSTASCRGHLFDGYYGLQFIRSGEIYVNCEGGEPWTASGPLVFFTFPGVRFSYHTPSGSRDHLYVCFRGERVERYLQGGLLAAGPGRKVRITDVSGFSDAVEALFRILRRSGGRGGSAHGEAVLQLERTLLLAASQPSLRPKGSFDRKIIRSLAEEIAEHPARPWDFRDIAEEYGISPVHFRRLFARETGFPPRSFLLEQRIRLAVQLLRSTDMRIKEIAYECGFGGEFYFSRQFRKRMDQSPMEYRAANSGPA